MGLMDRFYKYYNGRSKADLIEKLRLLFNARGKIEDRLAEVLGYPFHEDYGYMIGDHEAESLLEELINKFLELKREKDAIFKK